MDVLKYGKIIKEIIRCAARIRENLVVLKNTVDGISVEIDGKKSKIFYKKY